MVRARLLAATLAAALAIAATGVASAQGLYVGAREPYAGEDQLPPPAPQTTLWGYPFDPQYVFAVTRELRDSSASPEAVVCGAPLTMVVDIAVLPFALALGFMD